MERPIAVLEETAFHKRIGSSLRHGNSDRSLVSVAIEPPISHLVGDKTQRCMYT